MAGLIRLLKTGMPTPRPWGWFHVAWLCAAVLLVFLLRKKTGEKMTERVFAVYGWSTLALEILKQLSWSFSFGEQGDLVFAYQWYSFPFQLCTTPTYVCVLYSFVKSPRLRAALRGYLAYMTLLASVAVSLKPDAVFVGEILVNVHTSLLHMGGLFVSLWLLFSGRTRPKEDFLKGFLVLVFFMLLAQALNVAVYHLADLKSHQDAVFDMFYISPYYVSSLPVFSIIDQAVPLAVFMLAYLLAFPLGGGIVAATHEWLNRLARRHKSRQTR